MTDPDRTWTAVLEAARQRVRCHAPLLAAVVVTTVWTGLALRRPTVTYHLAPVLTAAVWPLVARSIRGRASVGVAVRAAAGGLLVAVLATAELYALDALRGPALVGGSATAEALLGAFVGAAWGARALSRAHPGLLVRVLGGPGAAT